MEMADFVRFITERQRIYERRARGDDPPWTDDKVLQRYHFCNVYRELDAGTQYLRENILGCGADHDVFFNVLVYRLVNDPDSYEALGGFTPVNEFDVDTVVSRLHDYDGRVFSPAYRIPAHRFVDSDSKVENIFYGVIRDDLLANFTTYWNGVSEADSWGDAHRLLRKLRGIGDFLAYEFVTDLNYDLLPFSENDFVNVGPGARRGLERLWYEDIDDYETKVQWIVDKQEELFNLHGCDFPYWNGKRLTLRDIEHSLCEAEKFARVKNNEGTTRLFRP